MAVYLPKWHSHCTRARLTVLMSCSDEVAVHSFPFICLQRQFAKLASGLFYCWSLLCNDNMVTDLQRLTWINGSRCFAACYCWTQTPLAVWAVRQVATRWYSRGRGWNDCKLLLLAFAVISKLRFTFSFTVIFMMSHVRSFSIGSIIL